MTNTAINTALKAQTAALPSITVVIPTLNEAENIGRLLQALTANRYDGQRQIIVVDGNSSDRTSEIVRSFPEVELIVRDTPGTAAQRNAGAMTANGDLLVFLDADNVPGPHFLSRVARAYRRKPFAIACPWFVADSRNPLIGLIYQGFNLLFWLSQWQFHTGSGVCLIADRKVFAEIGGFDEVLHLGEDIHLIRRAAAVGRHRHLPVPLRTSARRFEKFGIWHMVRFYARISPLLLTGNFTELQKHPYASAPYQTSDS